MSKRAEENTSPGFRLGLISASTWISPSRGAVSMPDCLWANGSTLNFHWPRVIQQPASTFEPEWFAHKQSQWRCSRLNRTIKDCKMADQADDLSIPTTTARPVVTPPRLPDPARPGGGPAHPSASVSQRADQSLGSRDSEIEPRKLIVGRGTSVSGEINSCNRLVVEGSVEANLQNCQHMEITETGTFNGNAALDDVEVSGRFEGDLV